MILLSSCTKCKSVVTVSTGSRSILKKRVSREIPVDILQVLLCNQDAFDSTENAPKRGD
jgi:hypothetical protein